MPKKDLEDDEEVVKETPKKGTENTNDGSKKIDPPSVSDATFYEAIGWCIRNCCRAIYNQNLAGKSTG